MSDNSSTGKRTRGRTKQGKFAPMPPTARHRAVARDIANGVPISKALPAHGYSQSYANTGMAAIEQSSGLMLAWMEAAQAKMAIPLLPLEVRRHNWHHLVETDLHKGSNKRVPILTVAGKALGTLAPENQTLVQVNVAAPSQAAAQWEDSDTDCQSDSKS